MSRRLFVRGTAPCAYVTLGLALILLTLALAVPARATVDGWGGQAAQGSDLLHGVAFADASHDAFKDHAILCGSPVVRVTPSSGDGASATKTGLASATQPVAIAQVNGIGPDVDTAYRDAGVVGPLLQQLDSFTLNVVFDGDSLTLGAALPPADRYPNQVAAALPMSWMNLGVGGQRVDQMAFDAAAQVDPLLNADVSENVVVCWGGVNDIARGEDAATVIADIEAYCSARQATGWKVIVCTITPCVANSIASGKEAVRLAVNASIVANWTGYADALADIASDSRIGVKGDENDLTYFLSDQTHMNGIGYGIVASIVKAATHAYAIRPSVVGDVDGHGTISPAGAQSADHGSSPTFTFTAENGYHLAEVRVDGALVSLTGADQYTFPPIAADHTITATYVIDTFTVTPSVVGGPSGHGTISPSGAQSADHGSSPTFTFTAENGYHLAEVRVDGALVSLTGADQYTFPPIAADHTITATYVIDTFTVTPSVVGGPSGHGTISPAGAQSADHGSSPTFTFTAENGYHLAEVRVDGALVSLTGADQYTFPPIAADHTIGVRFAPPTLNATAPTATTSWPSGSMQTLTWTMNPAVSGGEFQIGLTNAAGSAWYSGTQVLPTAGKVSYAKALKVSCPAGAWKAYVYYRPTVGSGSWTAKATSAAFTVTPLNLTAPTATSKWPSGSMQTLTWTMNPAVSGGEFQIGLTNAAGSAWYSGTQVLPTAGKVSYAKALKVSCPAGAWKAYVYYRPTVGSGSWTAKATSAAFTVTPLNLTAPTATSKWPSGSMQTLTWTMNPAVSGGEFQIGLTNAAGSAWYSGTQVLPTAGKVSYAKALKVSCPAGAWKAYVYYRPTVGSGSWSVQAKSAAFTVTP